MQNGLKRLLGDGLYPFPLDRAEEVMKIYLGNNAVIIASNKDFDLIQGTHAHESFEFLIPLTPLVALVDKKKTEYEPHRLYPINSCQEHGMMEYTAKCSLLSIQIDRDFVQGTARAALGKKIVSFSNEGIVLDDQLRFLIRTFQEESKKKQAGYEFVLDNLTNLIIVNILRKTHSNQAEEVLETKNFYKKNIYQAIEYLQDNYASDYSLYDLARVANFSPYHFIRVFKAQTGKTPYEYLLDLKMERARELLEKTDMTVTEMCYMCGFRNLNHFTSVFKRKFGISPSDYRK